MINNLYIKATPTVAAVTWGSITGTLSAQTDLQNALNAKQATLVSGTNIKTINGTSVLGSGDLVVGGGGTIYKLTAQTLTAASWVLVSGYYTYTFSNVNITTNTRVDFTPSNASYSEVTTCGMLTQVDVTAGSCTFYSLFPPQTNITGEVTIFPTI